MSLSEVPHCLHGGRPEEVKRAVCWSVSLIESAVVVGGGGGAGKAARLRLRWRASPGAQRSVSVNDVCSRREEALVSWQAALTD